MEGGLVSVVKARGYMGSVAVMTGVRPWYEAGGKLGFQREKDKYD